MVVLPLRPDEVFDVPNEQQHFPENLGPHLAVEQQVFVDPRVVHQEVEAVLDQAPVEVLESLGKGQRVGESLEARLAHFLVVPRVEKHEIAEARHGRGTRVSPQDHDLGLLGVNHLVAHLARLVQTEHKLPVRRRDFVRPRRVFLRRARQRKSLVLVGHRLWGKARDSGVLGLVRAHFRRVVRINVELLVLVPSDLYIMEVFTDMVSKL